jgi:hypothetical protein
MVFRLLSATLPAPPFEAQLLTCFQLRFQYFQLTDFSSIAFKHTNFQKIPRMSNLMILEAKVFWKRRVLPSGKWTDVSEKHVSSIFKVEEQAKQEISRRVLVGFLLGLFFDPKMEATSSSEMSVEFQHTTRRYILEDRTLHNHRCKNLRSVGNDTGPKKLFQYWVGGGGLHSTPYRFVN